MVTQRSKIRIDFEPRFWAISVVDRPFQQVECLVLFSHKGVSTGRIVEDGGLLGIDGQGASQPVQAAIALAVQQPSGSPEIESPRILRIELNVSLHNT